MARANGDPVVVVPGAIAALAWKSAGSLRRVVLTARKRAAGEAALASLAGGKHAALFHSLDVTDGKSFESLCDFLQERCRRVDVLINNAGIIDKGEAPALKVGLATVRETLETNGSGLCISCRCCCRS